MPRIDPIRLLVAVLAATALAACSDQSPGTPTAPTEVGRPDPLSQPVPGTYRIFFYTSTTSGLVPVSSLAVRDGELILNAHVEPAQGGAAIFQYCSYKGLPPNDIARADEAPSEACESGLATWTNLSSAVPVNAAGDAYFTFGVVQIPRTIGFRFRYLGRGSGLANGVSDARDFTWCPVSGCE